MENLNELEVLVCNGYHGNSNLKRQDDFISICPQEKSYNSLRGLEKGCALKCLNVFTKEETVNMLHDNADKCYMGKHELSKTYHSAV